MSNHHPTRPIHYDGAADKDAHYKIMPRSTDTNLTYAIATL